MIVSQCNKREGLSLLEVVLAMAIFLMALTALSQLIDAGSEAALQTDLRNQAIRIATSKLAEVEAGALPIEGGVREPWDENPLWEWELLSSAPAGAPNTYEVTVIVRYTSQYGPRQPFEFQLSQVIFDPYYMGNAAEAQPPEAVTPTEEETTNP